MKTELLAPVNKKTLDAALSAGADSIYLGLKLFSARKLADNYDVNELPQVINHCHNNGVKVFLAMNTLIKNNEINNYFKSLHQAYNAGIDAVIIQHISFVPIIRKNFPGLKIHVSTQGNLQNIDSINFSEADRVILPRELTKEEIIHIKNNVKSEIEIFVHGALCICYSGQCLMSSMIGGRSGNRGLCAQPCRKKYNGKYLLSSKDLSLIDSIKDILAIGVDSIKIEGRMKDPEYVYNTVSSYRKVIDGFNMTETELTVLKQSFNREFTKGHFASEKEIVSDEKPMNRGVYLGTFQGGMIRLEEDISVGEGYGIWKDEKTIGGRIEYIYLYGSTVQNAKKGQIVKMNLDDVENGDKVYKTSKPKSEIKNVINRKPIIVDRKKVPNYNLPEIKTQNQRSVIVVKAKDIDAVKESIKLKPEVIYVGLKDIEAARKIWSGKLFCTTPRVISLTEMDNIINKIILAKPDGVLVSNIGILNRNLGMELHLDYNLNIFNDYDLQFFKHFSIISLELNLRDLVSFKNKNFAVFAHGNPIVMTTKYEVPESSLTDELDAKFLVEKKENCSYIYNSKEIGFFGEVEKLKKDNISFYIELNKEAKKISDLYKKILNNEKVNASNVRRGYTTGHLYRGAF